MAESDLMTALARTLVAVDDATLAALSSVGLVRRAHKDLEKGDALRYDVSVDGITILVGDGTVTMPAGGPAAATCTCPAGKRCRHVLVATLLLKRELSGKTGQEVGSVPASGGQPAPDASDTPLAQGSERPGGPAELLSLSMGDLIKWVGRKTLREAAAIIDSLPDESVIMGDAGSVMVRFPTTGVEVRYLPGGGLAGMISSATVKSRDRYLAAAALAIRRAGGVRDDLLSAVGERSESATSVSSSGAPRTRDQVVAAAQSLLFEAVSTGLSHLSTSTRDRLRTLSISATGVQLPRLALSLRGLAEETDLLLRRDGQADEGRLFISAARSFALTSALAAAGSAAKAALVGQSRSRYAPVGNLELAGVAAYPWQTRSGYEGLTLLFWDTTTRRWCSWSDSRPGGRDGAFSAVARYRQDLPWQGAGTAWRMSRARFRLLDALRNDHGRLSGSARTQALVTGDVEPASLDFGDRAFEEWRKLRRHFASILPAGLSQPDPLDAVVVVRPSGWGRRRFLSAEQAIVWELHDTLGDTLVIRLPYDTVNRAAIDDLEKTDPAAVGLRAVVGRLELSGGVMVLRPFTFLRSDGAADLRQQNLGLDGVTSVPTVAAAKPTGSEPVLAASPADEAMAADGDDEAAETTVDVPALNPVVLNPTWREFEDRLQHMAESGLRLGVKLSSGLSPLVRELEDHGLQPLATAAANLLKEARFAPSLLAARYLCTLAGELAVRLSFEGSDEATASP